MGNFDLVSSLQALPETDPIEVNGIQFGANPTCQCVCVMETRGMSYTVCVICYSC